METYRSSNYKQEIDVLKKENQELKLDIKLKALELENQQLKEKGKSLNKDQLPFKMAISFLALMGILLFKTHIITKIILCIAVFVMFFISV